MIVSRLVPFASTSSHLVDHTAPQGSTRQQYHSRIVVLSELTESIPPVGPASTLSAPRRAAVVRTNFTRPDLHAWSEDRGESCIHRLGNLAREGDRIVESKRWIALCQFPLVLRVNEPDDREENDESIKTRKLAVELQRASCSAKRSLRRFEY